MKNRVFVGALVGVLFVVDLIFAQQLPNQEEQVYVCPLATKMEEINPRCPCRIDLILGETVTSTCPVDGKTYEMTLTITEYEGKEYYAILGFENGGAGVNFKPQAKISGNFEGVVGENLSFSGKDSLDPNGDPLDFYWDFGDGSFAQATSVIHAYNFPGNYVLKLKVSDGLASSTATTTVSIISRPISGGFLISLPPSEKGKLKEEREVEKENAIKEKEVVKKETKFLAPSNQKVNFKIPIEEVPKEKEVKKEVFPETEKGIEELAFQKETFLANLMGILKTKNLFPKLGLLAFFALTFLFFQFKNYFFRKRSYS